MTAIDLDSAATLPGVRAPAGVARMLFDEPTASLTDHLRRLGPLPQLALPELLETLAAARLTGRGGAGFPLSRKISAVAATGGRRTPVVVVNACEGDPSAAKDRTLVDRSPHLPVDGAVVAARALGARRIVVAVHAGSPAVGRLHHALGERALLDRALLGRHALVEIVEVPARFVASEASSLVNLLNSGDARPLGRFAPIWEKGVGGAPTLVSNAETFANLGLLARFGPSWFGSVGTAEEPGTTLITIDGAVPQPGVLEVAFGTPIGALLRTAGVPARGMALVGGLAGGWMDLQASAQIPYTTADLRAAGVSRGVGSIVVLPPQGCVLAESARVARYLADASAGQCGPCMFGLPAIASDLEALVDGDAPAADRLHRRLPMISGRGGCGHPDGAVLMVRSVMRWLTGPLRAHLDQHLAAGHCGAPVVLDLAGGWRA